MNSRQLDSGVIYKSLGQRLARLIHLYKAKYRAKERSRVEWLSQYIPQGGVILDVGAHFGYFSKEFSRLYNGSCSIYAFEPMVYNLSILKSVTNGIRNIEISTKALSDSSGILDLSIPVKKRGKIGPGLAHFGKENLHDFILQQVETIRLDDFVQESQILRVDFIKIDVEGAELLVFKGAELTIDNFRPVIFSEVSDEFTKRMGYQAEDIFEYLGGFGYSADLLKGDHFRLQPVSHYEGPGDYLFRP